MIKENIVHRIAEQMSVSKQEAEKAVDGVLTILRQAMRRGERIELRGFGVFIVRPRKRGFGRNPKSGAAVPIPAGRTVRFKPSEYIRMIDSITDRSMPT